VYTSRERHEVYGVRYVVTEQAASASIWKASSYRLVGEVLAPDFVEARPDARWTRADPFEHYRSPDDPIERDEPSPHVMYAKLANMVDEADSNDKATESFHRAIWLFVERFGLLGWFGEEFGTPLLPERAVGGLVRLVPDAVIDEDGRLGDIDPTTEGKNLQEQLMLSREEQEWARLGRQPPRSGDHLLEPEELVLPSELRFQRPPVDFLRTGFSRPAYYEYDNETFSYADVRRRYGVRVVFDPEGSATGVTVLPTREPVSVWHMLISFVDYSRLGYINRELEEVSPLLVAGEDGSVKGGWACPSLLKAVHLMYFLDLLTGIRWQKCQDEGCRAYFRVGPRSRPRKYCWPEPRRKESKCGNRVSSARYRERQRRGSDRA
jgi:hypothetical protein